MTWWLALLIGTVLGGAFGIATMCLLAVAGAGSKNKEKGYKKQL